MWKFFLITQYNIAIHTRTHTYPYEHMYVNSIHKVITGASVRMVTVVFSFVLINIV